MAELKISDYIDVDSIDGTELILVSKGGSYRKTTIEEIRNLANDIENTALADLLNKAASAHDVKNILNAINNNFENLNSQLSEIPNQTYVTEKAKTVDVNNALALKANIADLNTQKTRIDTLVQTSSSSFYQKSTSGTTGALLVVASGATTGQINLASVTPVATGYTPVEGDYVLLVYGVASGSAELIDARVGADGNIYNNTGDAIRKQVNFASTIKQLLDSSKCEVGWYYNGSAINAKTANSSYMTIAMQLKAGTYCGGVDYNFSFVLINGTLTALKNISGVNRYLNTASGLSYDYFVQFIVPSDATYYLTFRTPLDVALPAMLFKTDEQLFLTKSYAYEDIYKTYINTLSINDDINELKDNINEVKGDINNLTTKVINVDKAGGGDYISLTDAVNSVDTGQKATIYIQPNNYDLLAELGGDTFLATIDGTDNRKGISFKNKDIALIGIGNVNLSLEIPDAKLNVNIATCISAFEVYGNFSMENITLKVKNCRYAIHDESGNSWAYRYSNHKFKKCHVIHEGNIMWGNPTPYGCGTGTGASYEFDDCIFESDGSHYAWTMHNNANQYSIKVSFNGCYFNGLYDNKNIRFGYYGANTARNDIFVKNCILTDGIAVLLENTSVSSNNVWDIYNFDAKTVTLGA